MPFQPPDWVRKTNIYEVNVRQYTPEGTFNAFARHLPGLKDMGVETLWFMPIHPIGKIKRLGSLGSYYSISDHKAINPEFGTIEDFRHLVKQAHQMNFKVIIDWVANHTAWDHVWTKEHPEFYVKDHDGNFISPYDWKDVIQIDHHNPAQQEAMMDAMEYWIRECDIDGFRCDMAHLVPLDLWKRARAKLDTIKPLFWLAETEHPEYHEVFDASYTWELLHAMEDYWFGERNFSRLNDVLKKYETLFPANAIRIFFTSNHDENSHSGSEYERMGHAAIPFAVFCATWSGIPLVYSGQEMAMKKRLKFYDKDEIPWMDHKELHNFYKTLLNLHSSHPALFAADEDTKPRRIQTNLAGAFAFLRKKGEKEIVVILKLSATVDAQTDIEVFGVDGIYKNSFTAEIKNFSENKIVQIGGWGFLVYEK